MDYDHACSKVKFRDLTLLVDRVGLCIVPFLEASVFGEPIL
jgi:hypothetical protein